MKPAGAEATPPRRGAAKDSARRRGRACDVVGLVLVRAAAGTALETYQARLVAGVGGELARRGGTLLLRRVADGAEQAGIHLNWWQSGRIAGSIVVDLHQAAPDTAVLREAGLPAVLFGPPRPDGPYPSVWTDDRAVVAYTVRYLVALGHRRIARVSTGAGLRHGPLRCAELGRVAVRFGLAAPPVAPTALSAEQGARATRLLLSAPRPPPRSSMTTTSRRSRASPSPPRWASRCRTS